jgi:hypothetical protein
MPCRCWLAFPSCCPYPSSPQIAYPREAIRYEGNVEVLEERLDLLKVIMLRWLEAFPPKDVIDALLEKVTTQRFRDCRPLYTTALYVLRLVPKEAHRALATLSSSASISLASVELALSIITIFVEEVDVIQAERLLRRIKASDIWDESYLMRILFIDTASTLFSHQPAIAESLLLSTLRATRSDEHEDVRIKAIGCLAFLETPEKVISVL